MKLSLDDLDHKILQILEEDGRAPAKFIAEKLSVNEVTVSKRLAKIIDGGFCKIIAIADFEKCGYDHLLPIGIRVQGDKGEFMAIGVYNQMIYVAPESNMVIVKLSANSSYGTAEDVDMASELETIEFFRAIANKGL